MTWYPLNPFLINYVEDIVIFLSLKCLILKIYFAVLVARKTQVIFIEKMQLKIISLKKQG